ncbi:MAG: hypothetical protein Q4D13_01245 [Erysipelotrichaceae bacterium]|nr:hypothetical protein [Erysipelotrichaceae bacterium]
MKAETRKKDFNETKRKFIVSLKKRPHNIALVMMAITFIVYSFNLTKISNTTAIVNKQPMGLCSFVTMLFSMLAFVCFLNAYPKRQPVNVPMMLLMYLMQILVIVADVIYIGKINEGLQTIQITSARICIPQAKTMLIIHIVLSVISVITIALIPTMGKMLSKIDTSVEIAGNDDVGNIELSED